VHSTNSTEVVIVSCVCQVECKRAEPKDGTSSQLVGDVSSAAGPAMFLAQAADGSVGLVPASALHSSTSLLPGNVALGQAAAASGLGLMPSADVAAAATYRAQDLQPSLLSAASQYTAWVDANITCRS